MTRLQAVEFIESRHGKFFSVRFIKRTDGETREMTCRQGVTIGLAENPSKPAPNWEANSLIPVYDVQKKAYRSIPIEGIISIKIDGKWKKVK